MPGKDREQRLAESQDMAPVHGTVDLDIPLSTFWEAFTHGNLWPRWNKCMLWVRNRDLVLGRRLLWAFRPIRRWYPYILPATAKIVEVEKGRKVTWEVTALPGFYARHTYHMKRLRGGRTRFGSWEKATGWGFRLMKWFWVPHFVFVKDCSLEGARLLEEIYAREGRIDETTLPETRRRGLAIPLLISLALAGAAALWFYISYLRQQVIELAPGVYAVLGGGGNSLVVVGDEEVLVVDPKFAPASRWLQAWISKNVGLPVTGIVNTHYHYDHTEGNILYPEARILAHESVPDVMLSRDNDFNSSKFWESHRGSVPVEKLDGGEHRIAVGDREVVLSCPGPAHTGGDLVAYLPEENIVATGDLVFNNHYPFLDTGEGGVAIPELIKAVRHLADSHPDAVFLPGHGPLATSEDLRRHADYMESLHENVTHARDAGSSERRAAREIDLSEWKLSILPSFHTGKLSWATARNNVRWVYRILERL